MGHGSARRRSETVEQVAALPLRLGESGALEILLVTSRETQRWVLPKGNLVKGATAAQSAAIEALEEAGVAGRLVESSFARFHYWKRRLGSFQLCEVDVFLLLVTREDHVWKEKGERRRLWVSAARAAELVDEPGLQTIFTALEGDRRIRDLLRPREERDGRRRWLDLVRSLSLTRLSGASRS